MKARRDAGAMDGRALLANGLTSEESALVDAAIAARLHAYAPYSHFQVGAAARLEDGRVLTGVNVENASFGLAVCAERHTLAACILGGAVPGHIAALAVVADADQPVTPCGACRQVMAELMPPSASVIMYNLRDGATERYSVSELLPHAFSGERLPST